MATSPISSNTSERIRNDTKTAVQNKKKTNCFEQKPFSAAQREALRIAQYYRPYALKRKIDQENKRHSMSSIGKRVFDCFFSVLALVVLSPLMLGFLFAIYIEDPSAPAIFSQQRIGKDGKPFTFYKMRSMCADAEEKLQDLIQYNEFENGKAFKMKTDPRITKVGRIIRNTSIDELPQLVNVLKGDMSLVGPRPPLPREVAQYDEYEKQRLSVTPGLTCFWQICPQRHEISFEDWVALDIRYIEERSWRVDLWLIWKTVLLLLRGDHD